jgi:hypothetical protein
VVVTAVGCRATSARNPAADPDVTARAAASALPPAVKTTREELVRAHTVGFKKLAYDPRRAAGLSCIQDKPSIALDREELELLAKNGFVTSRERTYASFALAYLDLYKFDMPVFVSSDAVLHAWHRSYDGLLVAVESNVLRGALDALLYRMRSRIEVSRASEPVRAELDTYLTVAHSLLKDLVLPAAHGGSDVRVAEFFALARDAHGSAGGELFGRGRSFDFGAFKPRGHYEKHPELIPYFRAMTWLSLVDFRPLETSADASTHFRAMDFQAFVAACETLDAQSLELWRSMDHLVSFLAGEHDNLTPEGLPALAAALGAKDEGELQLLPDAAVERAIRSGSYGLQRIMNYDAVKLPNAPELPLNRSFALFGPRYSLESHTLHAVTEDRVQGRQLPQPGDVAFATFGNDYALTQANALEKPDYVNALANMRALADREPEAFWQASLYSSWVWALRGLSPNLEQAPAASVTQTEGWARRLLATELASWSELRHDSVLYVKESHSASIICKYPDAYVDPYPDVFRRLATQATLAARAFSGFDRTFLDAGGVRTLESAVKYFERAQTILDELAVLSQKNARGEHLAVAELAFVNDMIVSHASGGGCGGHFTTYDGWYAELLNGADVTDPDVTVADVHVSQEEGVLHIGKQLPRRLVVSVDWPDGVRAYVGAMYSYYELVSSERLNDTEWAALTLSDPSWLAPVVAHTGLSAPHPPPAMVAPPSEP